MVVVLSGALGGLILTIAVIIILITCRRSRSNSSNGVDHGFCFGSNGAKGGDSSDIVTVINRKSKNSSSGKMTSNGHPHHHHRTGAGSSSTASTNDSGGEAEGSQASNDSSSAELNKVEVRTSSSLSQNDAMVDDDDIDDVDGLQHHTHPATVGWVGSGVGKGLHVTSANGTASRRGNGVVVAAPVPVHSTASNMQHGGGTTGNNYVHVHPHQHQHINNNNNTNNKLNSLSVSQFSVMSNMARIIVCRIIVVIYLL